MKIMDTLISPLKYEKLFAIRKPSIKKFNRGFILFLYLIDFQLMVVRPSSKTPFVYTAYI